MTAPTVLLVDDREINLQVLEGLLQGLDARLVRCLSGKAALDAAVEEEPAVVLLDVQMPGMDGIAAARALRELPDRFNVPIIFITAQDDPKTVLEGYESGAVDFLSKPLNPRLVRAKVQVFLHLFSQKATLQMQAEQLELQSRFKSDFLANMSHELRTPLNAIIGFTKLMLTGKVGAPPERHVEYLGDVLGSAEHLLHIINEVLDLAKVESGKMTFSPAATDVPQLTSEVVRAHQALLTAKNLQTRSDFPAEMPRLRLDAGRLKQVLYNFISNAIKFTPDRGTIIIRLAYSAEEGMCLEVEDSGIGIPEQHRHAVFESFQQIDTLSNSRISGTGLGLAVTKRIVEAQGGQVGVRPAPHQGSLFWATFPLASPQNALDSQQAQQ